MKFKKLILLPLFAMSISGCNFLGGLVGGSNYEGYEEYFEKEKGFVKSTSIDDFNNLVKTNAYRWKENESTNGKYTSIYAPNGTMIMINFEEGKEYVNVSNNLFEDESLMVKKDSEGKIYGYYKNVCVDEDGHKWLYGDSQKRETLLRDDQPNYIDIAKDDNGVLFRFADTFLSYVTRDLKKCYLNMDNTQEFTYLEEKKNVPTSELLTSTLAKASPMTYVTLPAPDSDNFEAWSGPIYYKESFSNYTAYIANVDPVSYATKLKNNGFTVVRAIEDPAFAPFYGEKGGYWVAYDQREDMKVLISFQDYLYINNVGKSYGPYSNIEINFYLNHSGCYNNNGKTKNTAWTADELQKMNAWYDSSLNVEVPFVALGDKYSVMTTTSLATTDLFGGTLMYHHRCYMICDNSIHYYLEGYDQVLEANGFHYYNNMGYDLTDRNQKQEFYNKEESKFYNCYINEEKNCAIKYKFDVTFGNVIQIFKLSEMKSHLYDSDEA